MVRIHQPQGNLMKQFGRVLDRGAHLVRRIRGQAPALLRYRRTTFQLGMAGAIVVTSLGFMERTRGTAEEAPPVPVDLAAEDAPRSNAVFEAWEDYVREREVESVAGTFARRFRISNELAARIYSAAAAEDIRPEVAFGLVRAESSFRARAVSNAGAVGLTQVLPSTGRWIVPGTTRSDLMNPDTNLRVGFRYLRYLYDKYDGDERLALTAYNRGPGTVDRHLRQGRSPDNGYFEMVITGHSSRHTALMNARNRRRG
jgi:soluble lytic murein transglycosylase-like protein